MQKIPNTVLVNTIQQYIKRITHHDQVEFISEMQGWLNSKFNITHHINKLKKENHIISVCWQQLGEGYRAFF